MYALLVCFLLSFLIFYSVGRLFSFSNIRSYSISDSFFIGLAIVSGFLHYWSLFFPLNFVSFLIVLTFSLLIYLLKFKAFSDDLIKLKEIKFSKILILKVVIIITVLFYSLLYPKTFDSYLYHINAVIWNENYSVIPGLANLHDRYGLNSASFVLNASFSFNWLYNQYLFVINALSFLVFIIWIFKKIFIVDSIKGWGLLIFLYYFSEQYILEISSPNTDVLPNILVSYLLISAYLNLEILKSKKILFISVSLLCITLKISTLPVLVLGLFSIYSSEKFLKASSQFVFYGVVIVLPWIIRNIILTGYVIYPMAEIDLFSFDWKVPMEMVTETKKWIVSWARIPMKSNSEVLALSFSEWFPIWWNSQLLKNKIFLSVAILSPLFFVIKYLILKEKINWNFFFLTLTSYLSLLLWLNAPDFRFSFGVILFLALLPIGFIKISSLSKHLKKIHLSYQLISLVILFHFLINGYKLFNLEYNIKKDLYCFYLPNDMSNVKKERNIQFEKFQIPNSKIEIFQPKELNMPCYDQFPCTPNLNRDVRLRGKTIDDGFTFKTLKE